MKKKEITQAVLAANRANAKKSSGPRTATGKLTARRNATAHGFFAKELALSDEEERELETIRRTLHPELSPETVLENLAFAEVLACIGRCKLALRMEMRRVSRMLGDSAEQAQGDHIEGPPARTEWYLSGRQGLREAVRLLEAVKEDFLRLGRIDERWSVPLDQAFGPPAAGTINALDAFQHLRRDAGTPTHPARANLQPPSAAFLGPRAELQRG